MEEDSDWFSSPLSSTPNIVIFINDNDHDDYTYRVRNRIIRGRPKRVIIVHKKPDDMEKFILPEMKSMVKLTKITDLHNFIHAPPRSGGTCSTIM